MSYADSSHISVITQSLKAELLCKPDKSNDPSSSDRIELLWNQNRNAEIGEPLDDHQEDLPELHEEPIIPEFAEVRQYLIGKSGETDTLAPVDFNTILRKPGIPMAH